MVGTVQFSSFCSISSDAKEHIRDNLQNDLVLAGYEASAPAAAGSVLTGTEVQMCMEASTKEQVSTSRVCSNLKKGKRRSGGR